MPVIERISLNVNADRALIAKLDDLFASGSIKGYYKTPESSADWLERHDPITLYLREPVTPELEAKVIAVAEPYIRSTEPVLTGRIFAPGMAAEKSPQTQELKALIKQAEGIDHFFGLGVRSFFLDEAFKLHASAGQVEAAKRLIQRLSSPTV